MSNEQPTGLRWRHQVEWPMVLFGTVLTSIGAACLKWLDGDHIRSIVQSWMLVVLGVLLLIGGFASAIKKSYGP
jgi:uncharacterized membrane protein YfcA